MANGTPETNLEQLWVTVQVTVCGAGVIPLNLKTHLPSRSSSVNTSLVFYLTITKGMNAAVSKHARTFDTKFYFPPPSYRETGYETRLRIARRGVFFPRA